MKAHAGEHGQAAVEYLAIVGVVAVVLGGLIAVGEARTSRRPPIDPFRVLADPVRPPVVPRVRTSGRRPLPPRRPDGRPLVTAPRWALP